MGVHKRILFEVTLSFPDKVGEEKIEISVLPNTKIVETENKLEGTFFLSEYMRRRLDEAGYRPENVKDIRVLREITAEHITDK